MGKNTSKEVGFSMRLFPAWVTEVTDKDTKWICFLLNYHTPTTSPKTSRALKRHKVLLINSHKSKGIINDLCKQVSESDNRDLTGV